MAADGTSTQVLRNREGWPTVVINQKGERHSFEHLANGLIQSETDFHGRTSEYEYDARGRLTSLNEGRGPRLITRDLVGRIIEEESPDGELARYMFNQRGDLVRIDPDAQRDPSVETVGPGAAVDIVGKALF